MHWFEIWLSTPKRPITVGRTFPFSQECCTLSNLIQIWTESVFLSACLLRFCYKLDTPQYLIQMNSDLFETFSVYQDLSPDLIVCLFWQYFVNFLWVTENEKLGGHTPDRYWCDTTFIFYTFFSFSVRKSSKMAEKGPKMINIPLFSPLVAKIWNLGKKVINKKFRHILRG